MIKALISFACAALAASAQAPKTWDEQALADWATPVAGLNVAPGFFSEREYYQAPIDNVRTFPVYHPDREPAGYWESLVRRRPSPLVELNKTYSLEDWIRVGARVFEELDAPLFRSGDPELIARVRSRQLLEKAAVRPDAGGTIFGLRWVVTPQGVELGVRECAFCHQRSLIDGTYLVGAPRISPGNAITRELVSRGERRQFDGDSPSTIMWRHFQVPWLNPDIHDRFRGMRTEELQLQSFSRTRASGVIARTHGSPFFMTKIPDLIGIRDLTYLDHTATHRHRSIGDLMRYAALITCCDSMDFGPHRILPDAQRRIRFRYPDEVLYALARYIYSLRPPANPNTFSELAAAGERVFRREGCPACHKPPLYTNNKLTLAAGFSPPAQHFGSMDILEVSVDTDPGLALKTRKGTGYYKIPSLKGVWYRGLYLHDGSVASLEELFDPERLKPDHEPRGWQGSGIATRVIPGHPFGLGLNAEDKRALLSFLRSL